MSTTVGLISLGCAKNLIDSEVMIGHLAQAGMSLTPDPELADVLIVNTCSFIDNAKKESIAAIHGAIDDRESDAKRHRQKIIVAGCLSQRFRQELPSLMPEVDAFIGLDQLTEVPEVIEGLAEHLAVVHLGRHHDLRVELDAVIGELPQLRDDLRRLRIAQHPAADRGIGGVHRDVQW